MLLRFSPRPDRIADLRSSLTPRVGTIVVRLFCERDILLGESRSLLEGTWRNVYLELRVVGSLIMFNEL